MGTVLRGMMGLLGAGKASVGGLVCPLWACIGFDQKGGIWLIGCIRAGEDE